MGDGRVPVRLDVGARLSPAADSLLLVVGPETSGEEAGWAATRVVPPPGVHPFDCRCCGGRDGFVLALADILRQRATGLLPPFRAIALRLPAVLAAAVRQSLESDRLLSVRFRLDPAAREN